ncbi:MAG: SufD family Fe-S cluster assembly protein, partial [Tepidiformaceae bacterium]
KSAEKMAFPDSRRMRPWKYLDVSGLNLDGYKPGIGAEPTAPAAELRERYGVGESVALLVQSNSETVATESGEGVTVVDFVDADLAGRGLIEKHLNTGIPYARNKFTALHYAYLRGGVLVNVAANAEPMQPVRIVRDYQAAKQIAAPHTLIVTGANSRVSIVEDFRSSEEDIVVLPVVEVVPGLGSEVRYTVLHRWGTETQVFTEQHFFGERDAAFVGFNFITSGKVVKGHVQCSLQERGSSSELFGLTLGDDHQHVDFFTLQDHIGADTRSDLLYKSALTDSAKSVYYGLTRVGLHAHNADANQENRNLLLSDDSKAESDPVLEILTNQVIRASHGATVGPVDQEQLYYMETRGIPPMAAEALLVRAFLGQVLDRFPDKFLNEELGAVLDAKLEKS